MSALAVVGALGMPFPVAAFRAAAPPSEPAPEPSTTAAPPSSLETTTAPTEPAAAAPSASDPTTTAAPTSTVPGSSTTSVAPADQTETATVPALPQVETPTTTIPTATSIAEQATTTTTTTTAAPAPEAAVPPDAAAALDTTEDQLVEGIELRPIRFPVAGPVTYGDDFGNCRDSCDRKHAGNDIVGLRLQPLLAATDGIVDHIVDNHPTAGWGVVVEDAEGWQYRYFHVNNDTPGSDDGLDDGTWRFAPGVGPGVAVKAGQILGWMGDSGNSETSVPHLHFEIRRPDGKAVNPFASLRWAQRVQQCVSPNGPFADMLFPVPEPAHEIELPVVGGSLLIDHLGLAFPRGRAWVVGDVRFHAIDGACPAPGELIAPPVAPTPVVPADPAAG